MEKSLLVYLTLPMQTFQGRDSAQGGEKVPEAGRFPAHVPSPQFDFLCHSTPSHPFCQTLSPPDSSQRLLKTQYALQPESPSQQVWPGSGCWAHAALGACVLCSGRRSPGVQLGGTHLSPSHCILHRPSHRDSRGPTGWLPHSGHSA